MKLLHQLVICSAAFFSTSVFAATEKFHLDYTFTAQSAEWGPPPHYVTVVLAADFTGRRSGDIITDLVFQNFSYNNEVMISDRPVTTAYYPSQSTPKISFSGNSNDFAVVAQNSVLGGAFLSETRGPGYVWNIVALDLELKDFGDIGPYSRYTPYDSVINSSWHISAVPEPDTYGMLLAGAGIVAALAHRRKESGHIFAAS